jgi:electron transfer flavoprotein beta subunit
MLAEFLDIPGLTYVRKLEVEGTTVRAQRETETGYQRVRVQLPALVSVTKSINQPRYPSLKGIMAAKKKTIVAQTLAEIGFDRPVGNDGAKTEVIALAAPPQRGRGRVVNVADGDEGARVIVEFLKERQLL